MSDQAGATSASQLDPSPEAVEFTVRSQREQLRPLSSLVASASRLTKQHVKARSGFGRPQAWQEDGWEMFDLVGEQRFLTTTLANRVSQARFYVGRVPDNPVEEPEPLDNDSVLPARVFSKFGATPAQRGQMVARLAANLFIAGDGWFVGIPKHMMPGSNVRPIERPALSDLTLDDLEWRMMSVSEVTFNQSQVVLMLGEDTAERVVASPDDVFLIRVWRPHPRRYWQADSPTRSSLPVLRELVGLTMHISAQVDSRLAGAGLLIVPASVKRALQVAAGLPEDSEIDPFTEALIEAMTVPIQDRSSASAVVPLVVTVPDDATDKIRHISFDRPLDIQAESLREESIRRLALGQDAPPELLLGTAGMNHWGAWLVREDVVTTHIEPPLALICDAITTQYLWPVLIEAGMDEEEAQQYVIWYDVSHMVQRPNRLADALTLHDKGAVGDATLREAGGFTDADAPPQVDRAVELAIQVATANPDVIDDLPQIVKAFNLLLNPATVDQTVADASTLKPGQDVTADGTIKDPAEAVKVAEAKGGAKAGSTVNQPSAGNQPAPTARGTDVPVGDESARTAGSGQPKASGFSAQDTVLRVGPNPTERARMEAGDLPALEGGPIKATKAGWAPRPSVPTALLASGEYDDSVCIVAVPGYPGDIPHVDEQELHTTLVYLGHIATPEHDPDGAVKAALISACQSVVEHCGPPEAEVAGVGMLGNDSPQANVVFLHSNELATLREDLMNQPVVARLYEAGDFPKYPNYRPHVTIGYGDAVDEGMRTDADRLRTISFGSLELWWGTEHIAFSLGDPEPTEAGDEDEDGIDLDLMLDESVIEAAEPLPESLEQNRLGKVAEAADDSGAIQAMLLSDGRDESAAFSDTSVGTCPRCGLAILPDEEVDTVDGELMHVDCPVPAAQTGEPRKQGETR